MTIQRRFGFGILIALCLSFIAPARADDAASKDASATSGDIVVGGQGVDQAPPDSAKFYEYRDVPSGFVAERLRLIWTPKAGFFFDIDASDISQKDARGSVKFGKVDLWKGTITWLDNPRRWGDGTRTLYANQGGGLFTLDDSLQSAVQAAGANVDVAPADGLWDAGTKGALIKNAIDQSAQDVFVGYQRRTAGLGFSFTPTRHWTFDWSASRERRNGTNPQPLGMYFALSPSEVAAPVDFTTNWETVRAEYDRKNWNVGMQLLASQFDTGYKSLTWDNQLYLADQTVSGSLQSAPGRSRLTLGTDNTMAQAVVYGGVNLPRHTRIDATISSSQTKQDDPLLPMTSNANLAALLSPLPATSFDGKQTYSLVNVRVSSRPLDWFRWSAWGRQYEMKNESPSLTFAEYVQTDYAIPLCSNANACGATTNRIQRRTLPYSYEKDNYGVQGGFKPTRWFDAAVSYEIQDMKREFSAVESSKEDIYKVALDFDLNDWLTIRATTRRLTRRADAYDATYNEASFPIGEQFVAAANEGERRFIWTDRDRDESSLYIEFTPTSKVSIYAEGTYAKDKYFDPDTGKPIGASFTLLEDRNFDTVLESYTILLAGRTNDKNTTATLGVAATPTPRFNLYADYTWEEFSYRLASRYRTPVANIGSDNPLDNWGSDAEDRYTTASLGFNIDLNKKASWKLAANGSRSEGKGDISTDFVPGGNASGDTTLTQFPRLTTTLTIATLDLTHRIRQNLDYTLRYWYESWQEDNWAGDQMRSYMGDPGNDPGSATSIYLGMDFKNYTYNVLSFMLRYRF